MDNTRRKFLRTTSIIAVSHLLGGCFAKSGLDKKKPNVLFIAIDDLNDWVGCLGGNPDTITPNLDRLAKRGVLFTNAHCAAPACIPSRTAVFSGLRPATTGIYENWSGSDCFREGKVLPTVVSLPQHFMAHGYKAMGSGKLLHSNDIASWNEYWPELSKSNRPEDPMPPKENIPYNGISSYSDWTPLDVSKEEMGDWKVTDWVVGQLNKKHDKPFFLGCGIYRPHEPWYVPQEYFDKFPVDKLTLPEINENDYDDIPGQKGSGMFTKLRKTEQWVKGVQAYLACINFADECVGKVIDALDKSEYRDNTIVVLWSDHGWHLGEKLRWSKFTLWEEATHNVLMVVAPGVKPGQRCAEPVNLLDIYPSLIDLCGLTKKPELDGTSFYPQLLNPETERTFPTLTTHGRYNNSLRSKQWRYTKRDDGVEELYDHENDPMEWTNLANDPKYQRIKEEMAAYFPKTEAEAVINYDEFPGLRERLKKEQQGKSKLKGKK